MPSVNDNTLMCCIIFHLHHAELMINNCNPEQEGKEPKIVYPDYFSNQEDQKRKKAQQDQFSKVGLHIFLNIYDLFL